MPLDSASRRCNDASSSRVPPIRSRPAPGHDGPASEVSPVAEQVALVVNGVPRTVEVEPRRLLVQLLREDLGLTGTHIGCDTSQCGTCTVLVDGQAVKSCTILAVQADGSG